MMAHQKANPLNWEPTGIIASHTVTTLQTILPQNLSMTRPCHEESYNYPKSSVSIQTITNKATQTTKCENKCCANDIITESNVCMVMFATSKQGHVISDDTDLLMVSFM